MTWATELFSPAAKTVTKVTRARPIISAAAVTAVRLGLRWVFSRARRPVSLRRRSSGAPAIAASGAHQARAEQRDGEDDRDRAAAHQPGRRAGAAPPKQADQDHRQPGEPEQDREHGVDRSGAGGWAAASQRCRAAIGGTRVERSAGTNEETSVTTTPISSATTTVRVFSTRPVVGRSIPTR